MSHLRLSAALAVLFSFLSAPALLAAETQSSEDANARIKALEQRVDELETQLHQQQETGPNVGQWRENFNDMFDRMQREMENMGPMNGPQGMPNMPGGIMGAHRPRLGVELDQVTPDLKTRFKNDVKEGAFVMSVLPNSPAEQAGLRVGDAITAVGGKVVHTPQDVIEAVRSAPQGKNVLTVSRDGKEMELNVDLAGRDAPEASLNGGWIERNQPGGGLETRTEVKASALELTDDLAKQLKLTDDQRKKMDGVLANHAKELSDEVSANASSRRLRHGYSSSVPEDVGDLAEKQARAAEKDLAGILTADQIKDWKAYRRDHSSVSVSQVTEFQGSGEVEEPTSGGTNF